jgi:hypothetical protein
MSAASVQSRDAGAFLRNTSEAIQPWDFNAPHGPDEFYTAFRDLGTIERYLQELVDTSEGLASMESLAPKTHEGRTIKAVRIRDSKWKPGRPRMILTFQMHAREWITGMIGVYTVEHLLSALRKDATYLAGMEIVLVPIVNPDGFVYSATERRFWRKNRRPAAPEGSESHIQCPGVDINRNFDVRADARQQPQQQPSNLLQTQFMARSGSSRAEPNTCSEVYGGTSMMSEPESQALAKLFETATTSVVIDVHSFGGFILAPYFDVDQPLAEKEKMDKMNALGLAMQTMVNRKHGSSYQFGNCRELLYPAPGLFADWSFWKGASSYIYEVRPDVHDPWSLTHFKVPGADVLPTAEEAFAGFTMAIAFARDGSVPSVPAQTTGGRAS